MSTRPRTVGIDLPLDKLRQLKELVERQPDADHELATTLGAAIPPPKPAAKPGDPFECPDCGGTEWSAGYYTFATQSVALVLGEDGVLPEATEWLGDYEAYDDTEDVSYTCGNRDCGFTIDIGAFEFKAVPEEKQRQQLMAALAATPAGGRER